MNEVWTFLIHPCDLPSGDPACDLSLRFADHIEHHLGGSDYDLADGWCGHCVVVFNADDAARIKTAFPHALRSV
jgi:hypothetical protein